MVAGTDSARRTLTTTAARIAGPSGDIEAVVDEVAGAGAVNAAVAVVCHPHPQHQGTMHNKVVHTLARRFARHGIPAVRFNYRGVGGSAGEYGGGAGEVDDAAAVIGWARERFAAEAVYLAGFSFGGMVALKSALRHATAGLITVAPAIRYFGPSTEPPDCPWLIVQGEADEIVAAADVRVWAATIDPPPLLRTLGDVGHYFHGALPALGSIADEFLESVRSGSPADTGRDGALAC